MQTNNSTELNGHALVPFNLFLKQNGRSPSSGWRWRKNGWIQTINIGGRLYVSQDEINRFHSRAAAGEFAKGGRTAFVYDDPLAASLKSGAAQEVSSAELTKTEEKSQTCQ